MAFAKYKKCCNWNTTTTLENSWQKANAALTIIALHRNFNTVCSHNNSTISNAIANKRSQYLWLISHKRTSFETKTKLNEQTTDHKQITRLNSKHGRRRKQNLSNKTQNISYLWMCIFLVVFGTVLFVRIWIRYRLCAIWSACYSSAYYLFTVSLAPSAKDVVNAGMTLTKLLKH